MRALLEMLKNDALARQPERTNQSGEKLTGLADAISQPEPRYRTPESTQPVGEKLQGIGSALGSMFGGGLKDGYRLRQGLSSMDRIRRPDGSYGPSHEGKTTIIDKDGNIVATQGDSNYNDYFIRPNPPPQVSNPGYGRVGIIDPPGLVKPPKYGPIDINDLLPRPPLKEPPVGVNPPRQKPPKYGPIVKPPNRQFPRLTDLIDKRNKPKS
jgi:hypothetical protein